jgi:hypothetical protein
MLRNSLGVTILIPMYSWTAVSLLSPEIMHSAQAYGALNEFIVIGIFFDDMQFWRVRRENNVKTSGKDTQQFVQLSLVLQTKTTQNFYILADDGSR